MLKVKLASLGSAAVVAVALVACGGGAVPKATVETNAQQALSDMAKQQAPPVTCPGDLDGKVGASEVCAITLDGKVYDVTVKVTSVDGGTAKFDVNVASAPRP